MKGLKPGASDDEPLDEDEEDDVATLDTGDRDREREPDEPAREEPAGLPWIYRRSSITDGRKTRQIHLQQSTLDRQRETRADVEALLGESIKKADLREAALLVGLEHVDEVADVLREWGYDFG